jgi:hypothetical protein
MAAPNLKASVERPDRHGLDVRINGLSHRAALPELGDPGLLGEELETVDRDEIYEQSLAAAIQISARRT